MSDKTIWYNDKEIPETMYKAVTGQISGWSQLEHSNHFNSLNQCFQECKEAKSILDLGCGAAEVSRVFSNYDYAGADLEHIIKNVAEKKNPNKNYIIFDINLDDCAFLKKYDIVLMNSFLSEIPDYFKALNKVLLNSKKYIIVHRQEIQEMPSKLEEYVSYAGLTTTKTIINKKEFKNICSMNNFNIILDIPSTPINNNMRSFVLERQKND